MGPNNPTPHMKVFCYGSYVMQFREVVNGLYTYDAKLGNTSPYLFVQTVADNKTHFTNHDLKQAVLMQTIYCQIGHTESIFLHLL